MIASFSAFWATSGNWMRTAEYPSKCGIVDVFLKADRSGPILLLNDTNADDARDRLATLPFIQHELITFDYIELDDNSPA